MDSKMKFSFHINKTIEKSTRPMVAIARLMHRRSKRSIATTIMTYAAPVWGLPPIAFLLNQRCEVYKAPIEEITLTKEESIERMVELWQNRWPDLFHRFETGE